MKVHSMFALVFAALLAGVCSAQSITGSISGVVTDSSGATIPGAAITVMNLDTNIKTTVTTEASGSYTASNLPRGNYRMEVSAAGFKQFIRTGIILQVQQAARVDVQMAIGEVAESVVVTADAARLRRSCARRPTVRPWR